MPVPVALLYATVSGNAEELAHAAAAALQARGHECIVENLADVSVERLRAMPVALFIVSTWGEGVPPPDAEEFFAALKDASLRLDALRFAVLALGSSMYREFCAAGRILDERIAHRGAQRMLARRECDTKLKADFQEWLAEVEVALAPLA